MIKHGFRRAAAVAALGFALVLGGCAVQHSDAYDYAAYRAHQPTSILVLPPVNQTPDIGATNGMWSQVTLPLAESGYYVFPVALVDDVFKQNGVTEPEQANAIPVAKLKEIFGADAALYIDVTKYGATYTVVNSEVRVTATAKLVDLGTGTLLWQGTATASSAENQNNSSGGLVGMLVTALVNQIANSVGDRSHEMAAVTSQRMLAAGRPNGLLFGPRSPRYQSGTAAAQ